MKKKDVDQTSEFVGFSLPSNDAEMEKFIKKHKTYLTEQVLESIEHGIKHGLPFVEVFRFKDSDFVITVSKKDYLVNVNCIYDFYIKSEKYELCSRVVRLQSLLKALITTNEKKIKTERDG